MENALPIDVMELQGYWTIYQRERNFGHLTSKSR
jgi:hypothetical protein